MSCEKRRLHLCPRDFVFPQYDIMSADTNINNTLTNWQQPSDQVIIPESAWPKADMPDDAVSFKYK